MKQDEFLEKLSEVAEWQYREVKTPGPQGLKQPADLRELETPKELVVTKIKPCPCPYQSGQYGCSIKINWWMTNGYAQRERVRVVRCDTCNHVITPKGQFVDAKDVQNLAYFIRKVDRDHK
jgi:hypothetical protein